MTFDRHCPSCRRPCGSIMRSSSLVGMHFPRHAIQASGNATPRRAERLCRLGYRDMVQERHETLIRVSHCSLPCPVGRMWHACPLLRTAQILVVAMNGVPVPVGLPISWSLQRENDPAPRSHERRRRPLS